MGIDSIVFLPPYIIMGSSLSTYLSFLTMGDEKAFKAFMTEFSASLHHFAFSMVGDSREAEEIVSDVFVKIWQQRERLPVEGFKYYLYKAVKNTALNYLKRSGRQAAHRVAWEVQVNRTPTPTPEELFISKEHLGMIRQAIQGLPPRCRQVFILVKEEGLSYEEVASLLEISKATVNVQMTIAVKKIWNTLDPVLNISRS